MRSIWKGSLAFGLVNVPIKVYSATEDHDIKFHQVHRADGGRIKYQRVCEADGKEVSFSDIVKAYDSDDGRTVVLTDEDFDQLPVNSGHEIEVLTFVPAEQIDPVLFDRSYYLEPDGKSPKAYVLLRQVLEKTDRVAVVHFALRAKTRLALLRVRDEVLVVQTLLWPDEVRKAEFPALDSKVEVKGPELKMAMNLVDSFAGDFQPQEYGDDYRDQLQQLIDAKLEGGEAFDKPETPDDDADVVDLLAALQRSVQRHKGSAADAARSGPRAGSKATEEPAAEPARAPRKPAAKTPARRTSAKKATADKSAADKSAADKPAARRSRAKSA
jgi:DNA end-binding protein Ku